MAVKTLDLQSVLFAIAEQKLGFKFGEPERVDPESLSVVLPIIRNSVVGRSYVTFPETQDLRVKDSGRIDKMQAENEGQTAVFIRSGTIFAGSTQERVSMRSAVILPGAKVDVGVRCIHKSRGIKMGSAVTYSGSVPLMTEQKLYTRGFKAADQGSYWNAAEHTLFTMSAMSGSGDQSESKYSLLRGRSRKIYSRPNVNPYHPTTWPHTTWGGGYHDSSDDAPIGGSTPSFYPMETNYVGASMDDLTFGIADFAKNFDEMLRKVKLVEDQVGLSLITEKGVETVEIFDAQLSWKALHEDAIRRLGPSLASKDKGGVFEYKPERAIEMVKKVLALDYKTNMIHEHKPNNGDPHFAVMGLTAERYTGEVVEMDGKVIHLMLLQMAA